MHEPRNSDGTGPVVALVLVVLVLLVVGGGAVVMWQRQQAALAAAMAQRERAAVEAARALAVAEQHLAEATKPGPETREEADVADDGLAIEAAVRSVLQSQQQAWNDGDIDQFMEYYWRSEDLTFSSAGKLTRSWQGTLDNYKLRYPSRADMGQLSFQNLEVTPLGTDAALVLGEWQLTRDSGQLGGNFTLVFRCMNDKWVIVHDHTSRIAE